MNEVRDRLHGKEPNEGCFLGRDVMKSRLSCEGKKMEITLRTGSGKRILKCPVRAELP